MSRRDRSMLLVFVVTVSVRLLFYYWTTFLADDAFITFRYATNIAHGLGFVYNEGQHVLGTSTPLFTFILSALSLSGIPLPLLAVMVSSLFSGLTAVLLYKFALRLRIIDWPIVPALAYALWPRSLPADAGGMETALFTMCAIAAFYYLHKGYGVYAIGMATLASLTRPEGLLLVILIFAVQWWQEDELWKPMLLTVLTLLGPWLIFATWYFGSPLPHSVTAKLALYGAFGSASIVSNLRYLLALHNPVGWILLLAALLGWRWLRRTQNWGDVAVIWVVIMVVFYASAGTHLFFWYVAPLYPVLLLMSGASLQFISEKFIWLRHPQRAWLRVGAPITLVIVLCSGAYVTATNYHRQQQVLDTVHRQIGLYLQKAAAPTDLVAAEDIGYIGYYSGKRILDRDGLVSPEVVPFNRVGDYAGVIRTYSPQWVVVMKDSPISGFFDHADFTAQYQVERSFTWGDSASVTEEGVTYLVWRRIDTTGAGI